MPGTVYPRDGRPRLTQSRGEVAVYDALRAHLPDGWTAWHSLRVHVGPAWEGEGDFVIAAPDRGVLVLEVKSGVIECRGGRWYQNDHEIGAPRDQARGYVRKLARALEGRHIEAPPWGDACVFPDVDFNEGPGAGDLAGRVIGRRDLEWLDRVLTGLFDRAVPARAMPTGRWLEALHALWGETWVPPVRLRGRVEEAAAHALALNAEQLGLLDFAAAMPRALVEGQAGSGKTLVAAELCRRRAAAGQRARYLCYTEALAHAVEHALAGTGARAAAIQRHACDLLHAAGQPAAPRTPAEWRDVSLAAACDALPAAEARPDLVVVDEAHDLSDADWELVQALAAGRGLWVFCDGRQHFWPERTIPAALVRELPPLTLKQQLRNPPAIAAFASLYAGEPAPFDGKRVNRDVLRLALAPHGQVLDRVRHELTTLEAAGARPEDIAILTLAGQDKSELFHRDCLGPHRLVHADAPEAPGATVADTFLRFKGLERPFVIVTELLPGPRMKYDTRMHIALTRATAGAVVVCSPEVAALDERLGRLPQA
ncbi:MAG TPA: NERD domain-containing protein [Polyangia bacterium]|jgi:hypothetical protein